MSWKKKAKELAQTTNMSWRQIAKTLGKSKSTVSDLLRKELGSKQELPVARVKDCGEEDNSRVLLISDMHIPYHHPDTLDFLRYLKDKYQPTRVISLGDECFPGDAEIMTEDGWVTFEEYHQNPNKVMQVHEDLTMDLTNPERLVYKENVEKLLEYSHRTMYSCTTERHNLVKVHPKTGKLHRREAWDDYGTSNWYIPRAASYVGGEGWVLKEDEIRFLVAFQADGTLTKGACRFSFRKERKYQRLVDILGRLGIPFTEHVVDRGDFQVYVKKEDTPGYLSKNFSSLKASDATKEQLYKFVEEIVEWDSTKIDDERFRYTSVIRDNVEFLHTVCSLLGMVPRAVKEGGVYKEGHSIPYYLDVIYKEKEKCSLKSAKKGYVEHNKPVYCVTVPTGMILTRQKGWVSVSGNCDKHALSYHDSDPDLPSAGDELKRSLPVIKELYQMFPVMDILDSNHGSLVWRKAKTHGIPRHYIKSYNDVLGVGETWRWHFDLTLKLPNGLKCYLHHGKVSDVTKLSQQMGMCAVQGHFHEKFKIEYWGNPNSLNWGLQVGCLIDDSSYAFSYNNVNIKRPVIGCAVIIDGHPILEPMVLSESGRWIGGK